MCVCIKDRENQTGAFVARALVKLLKVYGSYYNAIIKWCS